VQSPTTTPRTLVRTALLCAAALAAAAPAAAVPPLQNAGFETGEPGGPPPGWALREISAGQGFTARLADRGPARGRLCLELARKDSLTFGQYAAVSQAVPADGVSGSAHRPDRAAGATAPPEFDPAGAGEGRAGPGPQIRARFGAAFSVPLMSPACLEPPCPASLRRSQPLAPGAAAGDGGGRGALRLRCPHGSPARLGGRPGPRAG
jgi:hypothetical protein